MISFNPHRPVNATRDVEASPPPHGAPPRAQASAQSSAFEMLPTRAPRAQGGMRLRATALPASRPAALPSHPSHAIGQDEKAALEAFFRTNHQRYQKRVTDYALGDRNYHRLWQLAKPHLAIIGGISALSVATYFALTKGLLTHPSKVIDTVSDKVVKAVAPSLVSATEGLHEPLSQAAGEAVTTALSVDWSRTMQAMADTLREPLREQLDQIVRPAVEQMAQPPSMDELQTLFSSLLEPLLNQTSETVAGVAEPALGRNGTMWSASAAAVSSAIDKMLSSTASDSFQGRMLSTLKGLITDGTLQTISQSVFPISDYAKMGIASTWLFGVLGFGDKFAKDLDSIRMDEMRLIEQEHIRMLADPADLQAILDSPPDIQREVKKADLELLAMYDDKTRVDKGAQVKLDPAHARDVLRWRDVALVNRPTEKMPVELWQTPAGRKQYILNVAQDLKSFPQEYRNELMTAFIAMASRSVAPVGTGGPLFIDLRGEPGVGKDVAVALFAKHTGLPVGDVMLAPAQMGEGGPTDLLSKGWDAITATKFKTSDLQAMGLIAQQRLTAGRDWGQYRNGVLNQITNFVEWPFDDPDVQRIMKPLYDSDKPWWNVTSLRHMSWMGDGIFVSTSNARNVTGAAPSHAEDDGAISSRMHISLHMTRVLPEVRESAALKHHEKAVELYAMGIDAGRGPRAVLGPAGLHELRDGFAQLKDHLCRRHAQAFAGARMQYAGMLTESMAANLLIRDMLSDAERADYGLNVKTLDDFRDEIDAHYLPFIKKRQDQQGEASTSALDSAPSGTLTRRSGKARAEDA